MDDLDAYIELVSEDGDPDADTLSELSGELAHVTQTMDRMEVETLLSGEHDGNDAIVEIEAGAGGADACDWVQMLQQMYLKWAALRGFEVEIADESEGDIAGFRSTTFMVRGRNAFGYLRAEKGVHRLVRISPFDANKRRQTSFARVEVLPDLGDQAPVEINPDDLRIDYYRSSGAGGQHVNKTESAVRLTHLPTNIVVTCQNERSQHKNKAMAMNVLLARLAAYEEIKQNEREAALRGIVKANEWGNQDRSYVFQPYTMVKDLRTGWETGDVIGVMNGDLDPFMQAYLQWNQQQRVAETR
jgi:peptide chain release factor 2